MEADTRGVTPVLGAKITIYHNHPTRVLATFTSNIKKELQIGPDEKCHIHIKSIKINALPGVLARVYRIKRQIWMDNYVDVTLVDSPTKIHRPGNMKITIGDAVRFKVSEQSHIVMLFEARPESTRQVTEPQQIQQQQHTTTPIAFEKEEDDDDDVIITAVITPDDLPPSRRTRSKTPICVTIIDSDDDDTVTQKTQ